MKSPFRFVAIALVLIAMAALTVPAMARTSLSTIQPGDTVFVYETGLNVAALAPDPAGVNLPTRFVKFSNDNPDPAVSGGGVQMAEIPCDSPGVLSIYSEPVYSNSIWFAMSGGEWNKSKYVSIRNPDVTLDVVLNDSHIDSVNGKTVTRASKLSFKLISSYVANYYKVGTTPNAKVDIQITTPSGGSVSVFGSNTRDLSDITMGTTVTYTDQVADIGFISLNTLEAGRYTARAVWDSSMPWYHQSPDSNQVSFTITSKILTITTNKETVVSGTGFVVTINGESNKDYYLYIKGDSSAGYPKFLVGQTDVNITPSAQSIVNAFVGDEAGVDKTSAIVRTSVGGSVVAQFETDDVTDDEQFTIKVIDPADSSKYDSVTVSIQKGQVTLTMGEEGVFYMGDVITLTGTSTQGDYVYLFITGPNLASDGLKLDDAETPVEDGEESTFKVVEVDADQEWKYKWDTSAITGSLDSGTYTIYAVDAPVGKHSVGDHSYETASVTIKTGYISLGTVPNTIAKGDDVIINGTASGNPTAVYVWIFGKNYRNIYKSVSVDSNSKFTYKMNNVDLYDGQYYVVVQHPRGSGSGVIGADNSGHACSGTGCAGMVGNNASYNFGFVKLVGLQASDAATALKDALDSPNIDDVYAWTSFTIASPFIRIDSIPDHSIGDTLSIHGVTNLAVGDELLINVISVAFTPTTKSQANEFSAAAGSTTVTAGEPGDFNEFAIQFETDQFKPDQYSVMVESIETDATGTTSFIMREFVPTPVPTTLPPTPQTTVPTPPPTTVPTPPPTTVPTTVPTTPEPTPGFGAFVALIGLVAVAFLVLRRR